MSDDTVDDLMEATYRALCKHGYAELTMQDIAAETDKSKGTLHYHFDGKADLLESFLGFLLDRFEDRLETLAGETPAERLHALFDELLTASDDDAEEFRTAILEIKSQSPYNEAYRERLTEFDRTMHDRIADFVGDGIEAGQFREDVDPDETAEFLVTVFHGAQTRAAAVDRSLERTRRYVHAYIDDLRVDDSSPDGDDASAADGTADASSAAETSATAEDGSENAGGDESEGE
ncbi:transcriptional regulator, TetR family [Haloterrigena turkmenica DSM 5511]|uniref:Transcriptional regulator, TetR family n=1 Tax=Haloterrigena turkmenica (strain ATCC 51198 / DSM 5511 / JCM 9101 / NCIMB 13204 / VKM B-1734 / 4k) TaxID=543526 RepID=D2RSP4_HALTV|nr:TetR/AcrR family transcriptional regulator [Haloterrigena turkmenica]ADB60820.1 transcriptional regulator, TetR family [Haloterrigena turkmenica DSM 5511]